MEWLCRTKHHAVDPIISSNAIQPKCSNPSINWISFIIWKYTNNQISKVIWGLVLKTNRLDSVNKSCCFHYLQIDQPNMLFTILKQSLTANQWPYELNADHLNSTLTPWTQCAGYVSISSVKFCQNNITYSFIHSQYSSSSPSRNYL